MPKVQSAIAVALIDLAAHGVKAGQLVEADAALLKQLAADGAVDQHKDAVAYARSINAPVVDLLAKAKAEEAAAEKDNAIAELLVKLNGAAEADKPALQQQIDALRAD